MKNKITSKYARKQNKTRPKKHKASILSTMGKDESRELGGGGELRAARDELKFSLSPFTPENSVPRVRFDCPFPRQPAHFPHPG